MKTLNMPVPPGGTIGPVPPGGTIGIVGGGQLGRMLALAAARLGLKTAIYNDAADAPAFQVTHTAVAAPYEDLDALARPRTMPAPQRAACAPPAHTSPSTRASTILSFIGSSLSNHFTV